MFVSVPGIATSQMNVHAVVQYNGYTGGQNVVDCECIFDQGDDELCVGCEE